MNTELFLVLDNKKYFYEMILDDINFQSIYRKLNNAETVFLQKTGRFYTLAPFFFGKWKYDISMLKKIVVFDTAYTPELGKYIKKKNTNCKLILYFYNPVLYDYQRKYIKDKNIDEVWSFDKGNVIKYGLKFNSTFYSNKLSKLGDGQKSVYDVVYIGRDKSRNSFLNNIENVFKTNQINYWFHVVKDEADYMDYNDYLEFVYKSKCILDITQDGQQGLTMRFMESLFLEKKLITNNINIVTYDFYNPHNIFIIGHDDYKNLKEFLSAPYICIEKRIISQYDVLEWSQRFIGGSNAE